MDSFCSVQLQHGILPLPIQTAWSCNSGTIYNSAASAWNWNVTLRHVTTWISRSQTISWRRTSARSRTELVTGLASGGQSPHVADVSYILLPILLWLYNPAKINNIRGWDLELSIMTQYVFPLYEGRLISLSLYKENKLRDWKKCIYSTYSPVSSTHLRLRCSNFFNPSKKNSFGCAANRKIGKAKDLSAPLRTYNLRSN
jgi:hypothetical protein